MSENIVDEKILATLQGLLELVNLKRHIAQADGSTRDLAAEFAVLGSDALHTHLIDKVMFSEALIKITFKDCQRHFFLISSHDGKLVAEFYRYKELPCFLDKPVKEIS